MSQKTDAELLAAANVIRTETTPKANTAQRVGQLLVDIVDSKLNDEDTPTGAVESVTGDGVDNTDAANPEINFPTLAQAIAKGNAIATDTNVSVNGDSVLGFGSAGNNRTLAIYGPDGDMSFNIPGSVDADGDMYKRGSDGFLDRMTPDETRAHIAAASINSGIYILAAGTSSSPINMNAQHREHVVFVGAGNVTEASTFNFTNAENLKRFEFIFTITDIAHSLTFSSFFKGDTSDTRWNSSTHTWASDFAVGTFKAIATYDGTNWTIDFSKAPYA